MDDALQERKTKVIQWVKKNTHYFVWLILGLIAAFGYYIRTRSLPFLIDATTGDYFPSDPDAIGILRYVRYLLEHGQLMDIDYMRFYPMGYANVEEFSLLTHLIAYWYKILHFFVPSATVGYADVIYPAAAFVVALVFFFLLVRKAFNWKVALVASAFLTVIPAYLFRTLSGVSDKEAMAMIFFYFSLYAFLAFILEPSKIKSWIFTIVGGLAMGGLWWMWGGIVFVTTTIGLFVLILILLNKLSPRHLAMYAVFLLTTYLVLLIGFPLRAGFISLLTSPTSGILFFALGVGAVHYAVFTKDYLKIKQKIPWYPPLVSIGIVLGIGVLAIIIAYGPTFITDRISNMYIDLVRPFSRDRWALTVAESHQPYFVDWVGQFTWRFLIAVFAGAVVLFHQIVKPLGKKGYALTAAYAIMILAIALNRYSGSASIFNGETPLAILVYLGSIAGFIVYLGVTMYRAYVKDHDVYEQFTAHLPLGSLLISLFFFFALIGARSAVRLLFVLAPATVIIVAFLVFAIVQYASQQLTDKVPRYTVFIVLALGAILMLNAFAQSTIAQASNAGTSYSQQWQYGMDWVRENTPTDAVFAHWWDYGYYVQTGGERATLSDGGNAVPSINHFIGRHLLTGQNDTEALEILAAKNATHVLVISDEIGKYGAFSSIGADAAYDRLSWISAFTFDASQSQETRNGTIATYIGGTALDDDLVYNDILFPANSAGIGAIIVPVMTDENGTITAFEQPSAIIIYNGQYLVPLTCLFVNGETILFDGDGIDGCAMLVPQWQGDQFNPIGSILYLSPEVRRTWFTKYYLFGETSDYFELVYSDEDSVPLGLYNGGVIGPLKIWEVHYPDNLTIPEEYYGTYIPPEVTQV